MSGNSWHRSAKADPSMWENLESGLLEGQAFGKDSERAAAMRQLVAVVDFLEGAGVSNDEIVPLTTLVRALSAAEEGQKHPILTPKKLHNRPPVSSWQLALRGCAVAAMECLVRAGATKQQAASRVARVVQRWPQVTAEMVDPAKVIRWRKHAREGSDEYDKAIYDRLMKSAASEVKRGGLSWEAAGLSLMKNFPPL